MLSELQIKITYLFLTLDLKQPDLLPATESASLAWPLFPGTAQSRLCY